MIRSEFLNGLRNSLQTRVDAKTVEDNVAYYENYILTESRKGRSEEEVLEELGDPSLIADSILNSMGIDPMGYESVVDSYDYSNRNNGYGNDGENKNYTEITGVKAKILVITAILAVALVLIGVIAMVLGIIGFLAPVLVPLLIVVLIVRVFFRR